MNNFAYCERTELASLSLEGIILLQKARLTTACD